MWGRRLFVVYLALYGGFVLLAAFAPAIMEREFAGGVNVAVAYGLGLIGAALVLALVYTWLCRDPNAPARTLPDREGRP